MSQIANAQPQGRLIFRATPSIPGGATELRQATGPQHNSPETSRETTGPVLDGGRALDFFSQGLRQHVLVEREIGHQPFQPGCSPLPPAATGGVHSRRDGRTSSSRHRTWRSTDAELPAEVADRGPAFGLADGIDDLLFGEF